MNYEVGKYYEVVCMEMKNQYDTKKKNIFVPLFDLLHKDPKLGGDFFHYHIDARFSNKRVDDIFDIEDGKTACVVGGKEPDTFTWVKVKKVTKRLKCKRLTTQLKVPKRNEKYWNIPLPSSVKYWAWYDSMVGKSCKGKRCPHLGTEMLEMDGKLICPLHNLRGDLKKEIII